MSAAAALMLGMEEQPRRKNTGEPGNGGRFARHARHEADVELNGTSTQEEPAGWAEMPREMRLFGIAQPETPVETLEYVARNHGTDDLMMLSLASNPSATASQLDVAAQIQSHLVRTKVVDHKHTSAATLAAIQEWAEGVSKSQSGIAATSWSSLDREVHLRAAIAFSTLATSARQRSRQK